MHSNLVTLEASGHFLDLIFGGQYLCLVNVAKRAFLIRVPFDVA
jgi:hypothetical protein